MLEKKIFFVSLCVVMFLGGCKRQQKKCNKTLIVTVDKPNNKRTFIIPSKVVLCDTNASAHKNIKKSRIKKQKKLSHSTSFSLTSQECEARMMDIPVPAHAQLIEGATDQKGSMSVTYTTIAASDSVTCFYRQEMERMGWQKLYAFESADYSLYHFSRPDGVCYVMIAADKSSSWWSKKTTTLRIITG